MVLCQHCGSQNSDPGGALETWRCGVCGQGPLVRVPESDAPPRPHSAASDAVAGGTIGGTVGAVIGGPFGAAMGIVFGAALAAAVVAAASKRKPRARSYR